MKVFSRLILALLLGLSNHLNPKPVYSAAVDSEQRGADPVLRYFQFKQTIAGYVFELDLYEPDDARALKVSQAIFSELRGRSQVLKNIQAQVQKSKQSRISLSSESYEHVFALKEFCELSEGAFDPSELPLQIAWGFSRGSFDYHYPASEDLKQALKQVNCQALDLQATPRTLFITQAELDLNWDSWTPAWLLQQGAAYLQSSDLPAARLKIGAQAYYHGIPPSARAWKVPLPHPRQKNEIYAYLYLKNQSLIVLGDYQNYFFHNGIRYSNLLDDRSGMPARDTVAVYVTSNNAFTAYLTARSVAVLNTLQSQKLKKHLQSGEVLKLVERNGMLSQEVY